MREMTDSARETLLLALRLRAQSLDPTDGTLMREAADMIERLVIEVLGQRASLERLAEDEQEARAELATCWEALQAQTARAEAMRPTLPAEGCDSVAAAQSSSETDHV